MLCTTYEHVEDIMSGRHKKLEDIAQEIDETSVHVLHRLVNEYLSLRDIIEMYGSVEKFKYSKDNYLEHCLRIVIPSKTNPIIGLGDRGVSLQKIVAKPFFSAREADVLTRGFTESDFKREAESLSNIIREKAGNKIRKHEYFTSNVSLRKSVQKLLTDRGFAVSECDYYNVLLIYW